MAKRSKDEYNKLAEQIKEELVRAGRGQLIDVNTHVDLVKDISEIFDKYNLSIGEQEFILREMLESIRMTKLITWIKTAFGMLEPEDKPNLNAVR